MRNNKTIFDTNFLLPSFVQQFNENFVHKLKLHDIAVKLQKKLGLGENLVILLGVSGVGRDTVLEECLSLISGSERIRRVSTREKRDDSRESERMIFLDKKDFEKKFETKDIFFAGRYCENNQLYGVDSEEIKKIKNKKNFYFIENTLIGLALKKLFPKSHLIVLIPPSFKFLKNRLLSRRDKSSLERFDNSCLEIKSIILNIKEMMEHHIVDLTFVNIDSKNTASEIVEFLNNPEMTDKLKKRFFKQIKNYEQ